MCVTDSDELAVHSAHFQVLTALNVMGFGELAGFGGFHSSNNTNWQCRKLKLVRQPRLKYEKEWPFRATPLS